MSISQGRSAFSFLKTGLLASALALSAQAVIAQDYVMKISIGDAPLPEDVEHYNQTGLRNFETDLEELSGGRIDVHDVLKPIYEEASRALGREFEYPHSDSSLA